MQRQLSATTQRKPHPFRLLHRYGGILSALFVIIICTTGIALNHTDDLNLGNRTVNARWLLNWYGLDVPEAVAYGTGGHFASQLNDTIYLDALPLDGRFSRLRGIIAAENTYVVATDDELIPLNDSGELIEIINAMAGVPADIRRIGRLPDNTLVIDTSAGMWRSTPELLDWQLSAGNMTPAWSNSVELPPTLLDAIQSHYRGTGLTMERMILDLHSGRLLGRAGPWLADAAAVVFILLAMTGIWMWFKTRHKTA